MPHACVCHGKEDGMEVQFCCTRTEKFQFCLLRSTNLEMAHVCLKMQTFSFLIVVLGPVTWCTLGVSFSFFVRNSDQIVRVRFYQ